MMSISLAGTALFRRMGDSGVRFRIASKITADVLPSNGWRPVAISYRTTPREKISERASSELP